MFFFQSYRETSNELQINKWSMIWFDHNKAFYRGCQNTDSFNKKLAFEKLLHICILNIGLIKNSVHVS